MGDPHFGMRSWGAQTGADFDLKIARRLHYAAIDRLVDDALPAHHALLIELGDFFHADDETARTPASGHALDVDSRHAHVLEVGFDAMVYMTKALLRKHQKVTVRIVQGNHDPQSSVALALALDAYFRSDPRVTIDRAPTPRWYFRFGNVLIGATHGHQCKPAKLGDLMARERPADWGSTAFRYFFYGHIHHKDAKDYSGCWVESFRTLAPPDAWHAGEGYGAWRDMQCIFLHRKYGERVRHTWPVQMMSAKKAARR